MGESTRLKIAFLFFFYLFSFSLFAWLLNV
nr:MAG TPA_asm: hypothetical protein [Caudoviricetes sp.]